MMKALWICGLPDEVRRRGIGEVLSPVKTHAWSWILGHLPPPADVELHIFCPVVGLKHPFVDFVWQGAHWHCVRQKRFELAFCWLRVYLVARKLVKRIRPDVIHGWGGETGCGWLATLLSRRAVVSVQGLLLLFDSQLQKKNGAHKRRLSERILYGLEGLTYRRAKILLTESAVSQRELEHYYGCSSVVVTHPLRHSFLTGDGCLARDHEGARMIFVGQMNARKGPIDLVEAFSRVDDQAATLVMVGDGVDFKRVYELVRSKKLEDRVDLKTACSSEEIRQLMTIADLFTLPSYGDTGPTALKEALSQGLYPVCYDNTGPGEYVRKYCGKLVRTGDIEAYAHALNVVLRDLDRCRSEAKMAAERVRDELSPQAVWSKLTDVYKRVIQ